MNEIVSLASHPLRFEDQVALDKALDLMPLGELYEKAEQAAERDTQWGLEEHLVMAFLPWFKRWFSWVNNAPCEKCGSTQTQGQPPSPPTPEEARYKASIVEIYTCKCGHTTRFPRYGDVLKLLETRRGRCGEWADAGTLCLRALGLDIRYLWNSEDHCWTEVWSTTQQRWIHVDTCEAAWDTPLIYSDGWGKKMAYCIAFSMGGCVDVTRRYVRRSEMQLPRTRFPEDALVQTLGALTWDLRERMSPEDQGMWSERDDNEQAELASYVKTPTVEQDLLPRQSGSAEWVEQRGEAGK